jgi:hypothetical protein
LRRYRRYQCPGVAAIYEPTRSDRFPGAATRFVSEIDVQRVG